MIAIAVTALLVLIVAAAICFWIATTALRIRSDDIYNSYTPPERRLSR